MIKGPPPKFHGTRDNLRFKIHVALSHSPGLMAVAYSRAVCG
jgi:hypothetical protein